MLRIAVISDTHGHTGNLKAVLGELGPVDWLLHAGDHLEDAAPLGRALNLSSDRVRAVVGNCDMPRRQPARELVELGGVRIMLVHGHLHDVKSRLDRLYYAAQEAGARVAIFGHSHTPHLEDDGLVLLFNPGSLSLPRRRTDPPSCGLIEIEEGRLMVRHIFVS